MSCGTVNSRPERASTRVNASPPLSSTINCSKCRPGTHVYTCGPAALNEAVKAAAERHQVPASQLHFVLRYGKFAAGTRQHQGKRLSAFILNDKLLKVQLT
jgi:ferredoxin-NADP reductase